MKTQLTGIAVLLFAILLHMESSGMGVFIICTGLVGLSMAIVGIFTESEK